MANKFWVGGTGTWDGSTTTHWSSTTGGAGGQPVPVNGDTVIFDASSGGGTVTVATNFVCNVLSFSLYTGTWDNTVNNNSPTINGSISVSQASGAAVISFGSGTYTLSATNAAVNFTTVTSVTISAGSATFAFTSASNTIARQLNLNGQTIGTLTIVGSPASSLGIFTILPVGGTIGTFNLAGPSRMQISGSQTLIVSNPFNFNSGGSTSALLLVESTTTTAATISVASGNPTFNWAALAGITGTGGATFSALSSFNMVGNTGIAFTDPGGSTGGGSVIGS